MILIISVLGVTTFLNLVLLLAQIKALRVQRADFSLLVDTIEKLTTENNLKKHIPIV